jgi:hypothetical protein
LVVLERYEGMYKEEQMVLFRQEKYEREVM